jgi:hypothetical protein
MAHAPNCDGTCAASAIPVPAAKGYLLAVTGVGAPGPQGEPGPIGPVGPVGPIGPAGPLGEPGPQGIPGETGPEGPVGPAGPQGQTGQQGVQGVAGPVGPKGDQGEVGPAGPVGPKGETGADSVVPGPVGPKGDTGSVGPAGPVGATGADSTVPGPQGPEGPAGPQGPAGADSTVPGPAGPKGDVGSQGPEGPAGAASTVPGPKGDKGDTGAAGADGDAGATGPQGEPGPAGATGPAGKDGVDGAPGPKGDTGAEGPAGVDGAAGPAGPEGPAGPAGADGVAGEPGPQGIQGEVGESGVEGPQGLQGEQGPPGVQGEQGIQGIQGAPGLGITYKGTVAVAADLPASATQGDLWIVESPAPAVAYVWDDETAGWIDAGPVQGPQGIEGPEGPQGPAGDPAALPENVVYTEAEQTLSSKTFISPKVTALLDTNFGKPVLGLSNAAAGAAAQNYLVLYGAAAGSSPTLMTFGEANVGLDIQTKGTGQFTVNGQPVGGSYTLPVASASTLGGVKVGAGLSVDGTGVLSATVATGFLPLSGGTMTGTIVAPTTVPALTFGTTGYNVFGASGGVAVRSNNTNIVTFTGAQVSANVPIVTTTGANGLQFGSGGPTIGRLSATSMLASGVIECATAPVTANSLANKGYVDSKVVVTAAGAAAPATTLPAGTLWVEV